MGSNVADTAASLGAQAADPGAFADKAIVPDESAVEVAIGPAYAAWCALRRALAEVFDPVTEAWAFSGKRHGWSLRLSHRDRPIVYLTPLRNRFRASLAVPERAMDAALAADLPPAVRSAVAAALVYTEGHAVRLVITSGDEIASVLTLARIRMAS